MPELPPFNPSVSVFHFTSKVSSAKIAKYKLATERGMVVSHAHTVPPKEEMRPPKRSASTSLMDTNKRPRLRLNVRDPGAAPADEETITVSRPRQAPLASLPPDKARKVRARTTAFHEEHGAALGSPALSADSSELSPCNTDLIDAEETEPHAMRRSHVSSAPAKDGYGDFMSYYVLDDDDTEQAPKASHAVPSSSKTTHSASAAHAMNTPHLADGQSARPQQHPDRYNQGQYRPPAPALAPVAIDIRIRDPDPVPIMIMKLEALSAALTDFGGVPPIPQSPSGEEEKESPVDNFLAMFGDTLPQERKKKKKKNAMSGLPQSFDDLEHPGVQDLPLTYGIQFIMNALKSWAEQRLATQMSQHGGKPRSGRPKRSASDAGMQHDPGAQHIPTNLFDTPEGRAISAFRAVVESGCLRVNSVMPLKLAKALRLLYMQIDHLINQSSKGQSPWRPLSYVAQIEANRVRVAKWKDAQIRAQEEMIRQQQLSHQQMMRQMGLPDHLTSTMFYHQSGDHETSEQERRNSSTDLVRLPTHPRPNAASIPSNLGHSGFMHGSTSAAKAPVPRGGVASARTQSANGSDQSRPGSTTLPPPRSGQKTKFSFASDNNAAAQASSAQGVPASASANPSLPWAPEALHKDSGVEPSNVLNEDHSEESTESSGSPGPLGKGLAIFIDRSHEKPWSGPDEYSEESTESSASPGPLDKGLAVFMRSAQKRS